MKDDFSTNFWATHIIFSPGKKWENIFWNPKVFYPSKKFFTSSLPPFSEVFLGYFVSIFGICEKKLILDFKNSFFQNSSNFVYMVPILFAQTQAIWFEPPNRFTPPHVMSEKVEFLLKNYSGWTRFGMKNRFWTSKIDFFKILEMIIT